MAVKKTHNSHYLTKYRQRDELSKDGDVILDLFSADGALWNSVKEHKKLKITRVEIEKNRKGVYIQGENLKVLPSLDLSKYDIIDLDAYGTPIEQLEHIFSRVDELKDNVVIFGTYIQTMHGGLPFKMLYRLGYTHEMLEKAPSLCFRNPLDKLVDYLSTYTEKGVKTVHIQSYGNKHYFYIHIHKTVANS